MSYPLINIEIFSPPPRPPIGQYFEDSLPLIFKWGLGVGGGGGGSNYDIKN